MKDYPVIVRDVTAAEFASLSTTAPVDPGIQYRVDGLSTYRWNGTAFVLSPTYTAAGGLFGARLPFVLDNSAVPIGIPPGNGSTTGLKFTDTAGAFSLTTTLFPVSYTGGIWLWMPIGAFDGTLPLVADLYWAVMSSTSVGQLYLTQSPLVKPVTTLNRWLTQGTTEVTLLSSTIPAGLLGALGSVRCMYRQTCNNSAGAKTFRNKFGGTTFQSSAYTTSIGANIPTSISNRAAALQVAANAQTGDAGATPTRVDLAIDTAAAVALITTGQIAVNTDLLILEGRTIEVIPG